MIMSDAQSFDLVVIGSGAGGLAPAQKCSRAGWHVAIVDDQPYGGTCALRGCDPKKILVQGAQVVDWQRRMSSNGVIGDSRIDWSALMRFKKTFTDSVPGQREKSLREAGVTTFNGRVAFTAPDRIRIADEELQAKHFVIAAGARPAPLGIPGEEHVRTSTDFLEMNALPQRIVFIGAGYISFEFAHVSLRAGAAVTIVGRGTPLRRFDQDLVVSLVQLTRALGADIRLGQEVIGVEHDGGSYRVHVRREGGSSIVEADCIIHGAGRVPDIADLSLDAAQVRVDRRKGIAVNEFLQSVSNPRVYAAGDATLPEGSTPLTPVAGMEGVVVASNLLGGNTRTPDYRGTPSVVFTIPALAAVGLTEAEARQQGIKHRVHSADTTKWYSSRSVASPNGMIKTLVDPANDAVLGAHLLGVHAEEVINVFALAVRYGLKTRDLRDMIYAYPTSASEIPYMWE
jgi:glutathione reductase (NADPH)